MPYKQRKYCSVPGCNNYAVDKGYCEEHKPKINRVKLKYETWYDKALWKKIRFNQLKKEPFCKYCLQKGLMVKATEVDHINPHKGDWNMFVDTTNLQSLCKQCHSAKTRAENG